MHDGIDKWRVNMEPKTPKILIVDDEQSIRSVLRDFLFRKEYEVEEAVSGQDAIDQHAAFKPDLILMDIRMPEMDGITALKHIREVDDSVCIIMLTAVNDEDTGHRAVDCGANDFITKPISFAQLDTQLPVHLLMQENE
jgi:DNA-binding response OmpR family regulator